MSSHKGSNHVEDLSGVQVVKQTVRREQKYIVVLHLVQRFICLARVVSLALLPHLEGKVERVELWLRLVLQHKVETRLS